MCKRMIQGLLGGPATPPTPAPIVPEGKTATNANVKEVVPVSAVGGAARVKEEERLIRRAAVPGLGL